MKTLKVQEIVIRFVEDLPEEYISRIADLLRNEAKLDEDRILQRLGSAIPHEKIRDNIRLFVENWVMIKDAPSPNEMALLVTSVAAALQFQQKKQSIDLIWTGPKSDYIPLRRTDQALIELINSAKHRITIVSFAVYKAKNILNALENAAKRGVQINIIVESPDTSEGKIAYNTIASLGSALKSMAKIFIWPLAKREINPSGKHGSLHAKVAIGDSRHLYISSANLTDYAMSLNMEMGILLTGGDSPENAQSHFDELIAGGVLAQIAGQ